MQELLVIFEVKKMNTRSGIGFIRNIREAIHDSYNDSQPSSEPTSYKNRVQEYYRKS